MASVRFICGTQDSHKELEQKLAAFLGMEDAILNSSCFDANGGLFETLLGAEDAIISDALNHAYYLMVCVCAKLNAIAMPTTICRSWKHV
ncbi:aminotransferase class I/II-fold pyridoxal phosphate-dependent enzyme [Escherichia coli]